MSGLKFCPKCGKEIPVGNSFCGGCGMNIADYISKHVYAQPSPENPSLATSVTPSAPVQTITPPTVSAQPVFIPVQDAPALQSQGETKVKFPVLPLIAWVLLFLGFLFMSLSDFQSLISALKFANFKDAIQTTAVTLFEGAAYLTMLVGVLLYKKRAQWVCGIGFVLLCLLQGYWSLDGIIIPMIKCYVFGDENAFWGFDKYFVVDVITYVMAIVGTVLTAVGFFIKNRGVSIGLKSVGIALYAVSELLWRCFLSYFNIEYFLESGEFDLGSIAIVVGIFALVPLLVFTLSYNPAKRNTNTN